MMMMMMMMVIVISDGMLFIFTEEIVEEPMAVQNSLFVEPVAVPADVNDRLVTGN